MTVSKSIITEVTISLVARVMKDVCDESVESESE